MDETNVAVIMSPWHVACVQCGWKFIIFNWFHHSLNQKWKAIILTPTDLPFFICLSFQSFSDSLYKSFQPNPISNQSSNPTTEIWIPWGNQRWSAPRPTPPRRWLYFPLRPHLRRCLNALKITDKKTLSPSGTSSRPTNVTSSLRTSRSVSPYSHNLFN